MAICLMHAWVNATHERSLAARLRDEWPDLPVACSSEILPQIGFYGRLSTMVITAYTALLLSSYLRSVERMLTKAGFSGCAVGRELGADVLLVPAGASTLCAIGALLLRPQYDAVRGLFERMSEVTPRELKKVCDGLVDQIATTCRHVPGQLDLTFTGDFLSGITARDAAGDVVAPGDIEAQCRQVFANIEKVLAAAGASLEDVVKTNAYVTRSEYMEVYRRIKEQYFGAIGPPGTVVQVGGLYDPRQLIEIEAIAVVDALRA